MPYPPRARPLISEPHVSSCLSDPPLLTLEERDLPVQRQASSIDMRLGNAGLHNGKI